MKKLVQDTILAAYRLVLATGILRTAVGQGLYVACYNFYKDRFEATDIGGLARHVRPGSTVIDVGANIGFFTTRLARWAMPGGRVLAIEPDELNLAMLGRTVARAGLTAAVDIIPGVAAEMVGTLHLRLNPYHPADHRIGNSGVPVPAHTLDGLLAERGWPAVSLIKIDVQGAEIRVLRGAREALTRFRPAFYVEIDDGALSRAGFSAAELIAEFDGFGYRLFELRPDGGVEALTVAEAARRRATLGYADYLFLAA
ncbi:MAG: FkbM family methyltransferase [bacterium]